MVKAIIKQELNDLFRRKISMLSQIARSNWQLKGEKNTKFFHKAILKRRKRNAKLGLTINDEWRTDQESIRASFFSHFSSFLGQSPPKKVFLLQKGMLNTLKTVDKNALSKQFDMGEIEAALISTESSKEPGPDGINAGVLKSIWKHIRNDIHIFFYQLL